MKLNTNIYRSTGPLSKLCRYEIYEGQDVVIPDGSYILYSSVISPPNTAEYLEVWASVPNSALLGSHTSTIYDEYPEATPLTAEELSEFAEPYDE